MNPFLSRLLQLQLAARPEDAEELSFLEEYREWRDNHGPLVYERERLKRRHLDGQNVDRLLGKPTARTRV